MKKGAGPPKERGRRVDNQATSGAPTNRNEDTKKRQRIADSAAVSKACLILSRYAEGLLEPFRCAVCGTAALDPIGWNGPRQPLCETCADAGGAA
jgi:hypothetical protein